MLNRARIAIVKFVIGPLAAPPQRRRRRHPSPPPPRNLPFVTLLRQAYAPITQLDEAVMGARQWRNQWRRNYGVHCTPKFRTCTPCTLQVKDAAYVKILSKLL